MINRDINFFNVYEGQKREEKNNSIYVKSIVGVLTLIIVGTLSMNTVSTLILKEDIKTIEEKLNDPAIVSQVNESEVVNSKLSILEKYNSGLVSISSAVKSRDLINNTILDKISSVLPSDVTFKNISIVSGNVSISASSKTRTAIAEVQHNLKALDIIGDVVIGGISGDGTTGEHTFDLRCVLVGE